MDILVAGRGRPYLEGDALDHAAPMVFTLPSVLSPQECAGLIGRIVAIGLEATPIATAAGFEIRPEIRNNTRVMFDDPTFAAVLFERIRGAVPPGRVRDDRVRRQRTVPLLSLRAGSAIRAALRRLVRAQRARTQPPHVQVYLNDSFGGGTTRFEEVEVAPRTGMALLFQHFQLVMFSV
ncbi:hypothetical protein BH11MYX1_BH11MYX1_47730 [soil metagenome]